jgi:hypothetical protein
MFEQLCIEGNCFRHYSVRSVEIINLYLGDCTTMADYTISRSDEMKFLLYSL